MCFTPFISDMVQRYQKIICSYGISKTSQYYQNDYALTLLFETYLKNRGHFVQYEGFMSNLNTATTRGPQGSNLGSLFLYFF